MTRRLAIGVAVAIGIGLASGVVLLALNWSTAVPGGIGYHAPHGFLALAMNVVAFTTVGVVVAIHHPANSIGWVYCALGVLATGELVGSQYATYGLLTSPGSLPAGEFAAWISGVSAPTVAVATSTLVLLLFPNGKLPSSAWRPVLWLAASSLIALALIAAIIPGRLVLAPYARNPFGIAAAGDMVVGLFSLAGGLVVGAIALSVASLVARYRTADGLTRQQIKWIGYAASLHAIALAVWMLFVLAAGVGAEFVALMATLIPLATGVAIFRYRLYEIDVLINRTLVYGALTASLSASYVVSVVVLQTLLHPVTGSSDIAVALSTLVVVAAFQPLRRRIQNAVDRRFYRMRYDAQRAVDNFAHRLRNEVDIEYVRAELNAVLAQTVRPNYSTLWLREERQPRVQP